MQQDNPHVLSQSSQAILAEIMSYHSSRLHDFEARMTRKQIARQMNGEYSLTRLLHGLHDHRVRQHAPYEFACSERIAEEVGRQPEPGFVFVPVSGRRDLTAGVAGAGGYLAGLETAPGDTFVAALHAASAIEAMGINRLTLTGNASIPRTTANVTAGWLSSEGSTLTESQLSFAVAAASPKTVGAYTEISGQWLNQTSPQAQAFVFNEIARAVAAEMDAKTFSGSGAAGQPTGLLSTTGIGSVSGTSLAWAGVLDMVEDVETANAFVSPERGGWLVAPNAARILRARERATGSGFIMDGNSIAAYRALSTNSVPTATAVFGDWSSLVILEWSQLQIGVDPYGANSALFKANLVGVRALWTMDVVVLRPASFSAASSIT